MEKIHSILAAKYSLANDILKPLRNHMAILHVISWAKIKGMGRVIRQDTNSERFEKIFQWKRQINWKQRQTYWLGSVGFRIVSFVQAWCQLCSRNDISSYRPNNCCWKNESLMHFGESNRWNSIFQKTLHFWR